MSDKWIRIKPSVDVYLNEIPFGNFRVKIIGYIVSKSEVSIVVNDGTDQIKILISKFNPSIFNIQQLGRFLIDVIKSETEIRGELLGFHPMDKEQVEQYRKIVKLERMIQF